MRYCVVVYGIFAYFRNQDKAENFINALPIQSEETSINQSPKNEQCKDVQHESDMFPRSRHIEGFRNVLKYKYPPRGYIKLLNRRGEPVSRVETNLFNLENNVKQWKMSIIHKNRQFDLKCESKESLTYWFEAFQNIGVKVTNYQNNIPLQNEMKIEKDNNIDVNNPSSILR